MPNAKRFTVSDVRKLVGDQRRIEVIEVNTQRSRKMTLKDFVDYYKSAVPSLPFPSLPSFFCNDSA